MSQLLLPPVTKLSTEPLPYPVAFGQQVYNTDTGTWQVYELDSNGVSGTWNTFADTLPDGFLTAAMIGDDAASFADLLLSGQGLKAQNFDRQAGQSVSSLTDGRGYFMLLPLRKGEVVTNIHVAVGAAGISMDLAKVGLYDAAGVQLAVTDDLGTAWESVGTKTHALQSPYTVPTAGCYLIAVLGSTNGGSMPSLLKGASGATIAVALTAIGSNSAPGYLQSSLSDLPATATLTAAASSGIQYWVGVS